MKNYLSRQILNTLFYPLLFVLFLWAIFLVQVGNDLNLVFLGISPRQTNSLHGIITSVFVHGDLGHIASNSLPILVLGMMLFYFYKKIAKATFLWIWVISGIWLWIGGGNNPDRPVYHIGASTLIYGLATFLFFSGVFRRHLRLMVVSALVVFLYGSIMWGVFPLQPGMSWEGHLFGAIAGVLVAFNYRKEGPQRRVYHWEEEDDETDTGIPVENDQGPETLANTSEDGITINYIYKKKTTKKSNSF